MHHLHKGRAASFVITLIVVLTLFMLPARQEVTRAAPGSGKLVMGYAAGWALRTREAAANIDGSKLTHIIYAFVGIELTNTDPTLVPGPTCSERWDDMETPSNSIDPAMMESIVAGLKSNKDENPSLKILMSIGGGGYAGKFNQIPETQIGAFATNCVRKMKKHGLDGIDVDYEFPTNEAETRRMSTIITELDAAFAAAGLNQNGAGTGNALLTIGTAAGPYSGMYQRVDILNSYVDYFTTMAYNYHGSWETTVHYNSPVHSPGTAYGAACSSSNVICMEGTANYWLGRGVPRSKLVIGVGFYGNQYTTSAGCGVTPGSSGYSSLTTIDYRVMRTNGMLARDSSLTNTTAPVGGAGWTYGYDGTYKNARLCNGSTWIGYEDPASVKARADWLSLNTFPGIMIWDLTKDYNNEMLKAICSSFGCSASSHLGIGKTITGSAPCNTATESVVEANDADLKSKWCSGAATKQLQIDLGGNYNVRSITIRHAGSDGNEDVRYNTSAFNIQTSTDNATWTTSANVTGNSSSITSHIINTTGRYVRLNVTAAEQPGNGNTARIYEVEIYGSPASAPATPSATRTATAASVAATATKPPATATKPPATATRTATSGPVGSACWPGWSSSTAYSGGAQVSYGGQNYQAAYWTQSQNPSTNSGPAGSGAPWIQKGACG